MAEGAAVIPGTRCLAYLPCRPLAVAVGTVDSSAAAVVVVVTVCLHCTGKSKAGSVDRLLPRTACCLATGTCALCHRYSDSTNSCSRRCLGTYPGNDPVPGSGLSGADPGPETSTCLVCYCHRRRSGRIWTYDREIWTGSAHACGRRSCRPPGCCSLSTWVTGALVPAVAAVIVAPCLAT